MGNVKCVYCLEQFDKNKHEKTIDHVFSKKKTIETPQYVVENKLWEKNYVYPNVPALVPCCRFCNSVKSNLEHIVLSKLLQTRIEEKYDERYDIILEACKRNGALSVKHKYEDKIKQYLRMLFKGWRFWFYKRHFKSDFYFTKPFNLENPVKFIDRTDYKCWAYKVEDKLFFKSSLKILYSSMTDRSIAAKAPTAVCHSSVE